MLLLFSWVCSSQACLFVRPALLKAPPLKAPQPAEERKGKDSREQKKQEERKGKEEREQKKAEERKQRKQSTEERRQKTKGSRREENTESMIWCSMYVYIYIICLMFSSSDGLLF